MNNRLKKSQKAPFKSDFSPKESLSNIITGQELERQQISQKLHDEIIIALASLKMKLSSYWKNNDEVMEDIMLELDEIGDEVRNISHALSPLALQNDQLVVAIQDSICRIKKMDPELIITFEYDSFDENIVSDNIKKALFFICQEMLYNIVKHANASNVLVQISADKLSNEVHFGITDDGTTFSMDDQSNGIGILNIKSRLALINGRLKFEPNPDRGMNREIEIPCQ